MDKAFAVAGIQGVWEFSGLDTRYRYNDGCGNDRILVRINPAFYRPADVECLQGNPELIKNELGWKPKISFDELVAEMVLRDTFE